MGGGGGGGGGGAIVVLALLKSHFSHVSFCAIYGKEIIVG